MGDKWWQDMARFEASDKNEPLPLDKALDALTYVQVELLGFLGIVKCPNMPECPLKKLQSTESTRHLPSIMHRSPQYCHILKNDETCLPAWLLGRERVIWAWAFRFRCLHFIPHAARSLRCSFLFCARGSPVPKAVLLLFECLRWWILVQMIATWRAP